MIVYLITYTVYLYNRFKDFDEDFLTNPIRTQYIKKNIKNIPFTIFYPILIIMGMLFYFANFLSLIVGLLLLLLGILYSLYLKKLTRNIVGFKSFYVSFIWILLLIFLILYYSFSFTVSFWCVFIFILLRELINPCFCDLKDIESDKKENLKTFPVIFGKEKVLKYLSVINIVSGVLIIVGVYSGLLPKFASVLLFVVPYTFYYFNKVNKEKNPEFLYSILPDGEFILYIPFILISRFLWMNYF